MYERFILECIKYEKDEMGRKTPRRKMYGLTTSFDMAHYSMEHIQSQFDDIIIHPLHSLPNLVNMGMK